MHTWREEAKEKLDGHTIYNDHLQLPLRFYYKQKHKPFLSHTNMADLDFWEYCSDWEPAIPPLEPEIRLVLFHFGSDHQLQFFNLINHLLSILGN